MIQQCTLSLAPAEAADPSLVKAQLLRRCHIAAEDLTCFVVRKRSIDARGRRPRVILSAEAYVGERPRATERISEKLKTARHQERVIIVGAGPAGYFAALQLLMAGIKPIVLDRGKDVRSRRRDLRAIQQLGIVNPNSNYCFGEGGAGTYSDGKLYTNSRKRGNIHTILQLLVEHGASPDILIDAHPHIGSNKLPLVVQQLRATILHYGGEVHFDALVDDFIIKENKIRGVVVNGNKEFVAPAVILATGHSARDIFLLLQRHHLHLEAKPFAIGLRIEHEQALIDRIQYNQHPRGPHLPAAAYKLVSHVGNRGVFSFCMCPGGLIVPAATAPGELVVNGMSMSRRNSPFANSGIVVALEPADYPEFDSHGPLMGMRFQQQIEQSFFNAGDGSQRAAAQRMVDFVNGTLSDSLCQSSYIPGLYAAPLHELLPAAIFKRLQTALQHFGSKMPGYFTNDANLVGLESRTSSPVRIPRDQTTMAHTQITNLYPCGEGAGYAGGIVSAALDGLNVARAVTVSLGNSQ